ncbi:MAG: polyprenol monophosphomannose synthase [Kineosporiaceae bacterium]|nr:polyprenol monophosphomannose synthase [Kineosporiaceae bacterium]MBK8076807.1 polyprenol monophosphomannose synthase [Kineosporiaceae bacterium]
MSEATRRPLVIIPTYDERQNLPKIVRRVREAAPQLHILVADDNSPDGTGVLADGMAAADDHLHVMHRPGKQGLGAAYLDGFRWGIERGFDVLIEMDADGSHPPERLPAMLDRIEAGADLVIGSRWVAGGSVVNWPRRRLVLSQGGNLYTRLALGIPVRDATAGFRAFRAEALQQMRLEDVESQGYCFQVDLTWRAVRAGLRIEEVPITFVEREHGTSKMSQSIVIEALWRVTQWGARRRFERLTGRDRSGRTEPSGSRTT